MERWDEKVRWYVHVHVDRSTQNDRYCSIAIYIIRLRSQLVVNSECDEPVEFRTIHSMVLDEFPGTSTIATSRMIKEAFPSTYIKRIGREKVHCVVGVRLQHTSSAMQSVALLPGSAESACSSTSGARVAQPSQLVEAFSTGQLLLELQDEKDRRFALERQVHELHSKLMQYEQVLPQFRHQLQSEADQIALSALPVVHGPSTQAQIRSFTLDGVIEDLKATCPHMYQLFQEVGRTQRMAAQHPDVLPLAELKAVVSMCTLLNARSNRVKGVQLLISLMLIARATNKQVRVR